MSNEDSKHPSAMTEEERQALVASDPDAFDEEAADTAEPKVDEPDDKPDQTDDAGASAESDDDVKPVDQRAFNGVLSDLRDTRKELSAAQRELQELREKFAEPPQVERDFDAEKAALKAKYDDGGLDDSQYEEAKEALLLEQAEARALAKLAQQQQAAAERQASSAAAEQQAAWDEKIGAWVSANKDFMSNPFRANAVRDLIGQLGQDVTLSDDELLAAVETAAFEAFNWQAPAKQHAARNAADAAAASKASATPPSLAAGVGVGGRGSGETGIDLGALKPGTFSKLPKAEQERLLGEGALDD